MMLRRLAGEYTVCKVSPDAAARTPFSFLSVTDSEVSLLCRTEDVLVSVTAREDGWKGFRIEGQLEFSLVGVLYELSGILAKENIGIFVTSTYDTDYIFVKKEDFARACDALSRAGHIFTEESAGE
ncbi:MAG: ACT domain-containing protein [Clostridia bacterium]|nr:ACT domain-containing protein [Clostridia bacterium]